MSEHLHFKDHGNEVRIISARVIWVIAFVLLMLGVLLARYYNLQVVNYQDYATQSDRNRIHVQPMRPTRGLIYDRNGVLLAENRPSYTLTIIKERVEDLEYTLGEIRNIIDVSDDDLERFRTGLDQRRRPFDSVSLRFNLTETEIARLAVNEYRLPGVVVEAQLVRHYPYRDLFTHTLGYVQRIDQRDLESMTEEEYQNYRGTDIIGKLGLEKQYETQLLGRVGFQNVETDARGRVLSELDRINPIPGEDLYLHLDLEVQKTAFEAMDSGRGAVVAIDVNTGGVIAMVSKPSYDPNLFVTGISAKDYKKLIESRDSPFLNRPLQGKYPPGSTVKPMLGLAGLHYGIVTETYAIVDRPTYQLPGEDRVRRDGSKYGHGDHVDLHVAIVRSCNIFFYDLAYRLNIDRMYEFGRAFGLGEKTGIDIPNENGGLWPSRAWKKRTKNLAWYPGETLNVGIGQGDAALTPLQLALMTAMLANRGEAIQPALVNKQEITDISRSVFELSQQQIASEDNEVIVASEGAVDLAKVSQRHWDYVHKAMEDVVASARGTAKGVRSEEYKIAGKTGTAQLVEVGQDEKNTAEENDALDEYLRNQALFISYAPADNPQLAVVVIMENGGHGGSAAAPVARAVYDAYFASEKRRAKKLQSQQLTQSSPLTQTNPQADQVKPNSWQVQSRAN